MTTVVELVKRVSENISDFDRAIAALKETLRRSAERLLAIDLHPARTRYLRRYRSKGIAMRRRAAGKRA